MAEHEVSMTTYIILRRADVLPSEDHVVEGSIDIVSIMLGIDDTGNFVPAPGVFVHFQGKKDDSDAASDITLLMGAGEARVFAEAILAKAIVSPDQN